MQTWKLGDPERRQIVTHQAPLAECIERYKSIVDKLDSLINRLDKMNGRYDSHLIESIAYRTTVDLHTKRFDASENQTRWIIGILISVLITIIIQIVTFAFLWGSWTKRVEINTEKINLIEVREESLHPRLPSLPIK